MKYYKLKKEPILFLSLLLKHMDWLLLKDFEWKNIFSNFLIIMKRWLKKSH